MMFLLIQPLIPQAYIDPNSGSVIFQIILGALLTIGVALRVFWVKIKELLGIKSPTNESETDDETN